MEAGSCSVVVTNGGVLAAASPCLTNTLLFPVLPLSLTEAPVSSGISAGRTHPDWAVIKILLKMT